MPLGSCGRMRLRIFLFLSAPSAPSNLPLVVCSLVACHDKLSIHTECKPSTWSGVDALQCSFRTQSQSFGSTHFASSWVEKLFFMVAAYFSTLATFKQCLGVHHLLFGPVRVSPCNLSVAGRCCIGISGLGHVRCFCLRCLRIARWERLSWPAWPFGVEPLHTRRLEVLT